MGRGSYIPTKMSTQGRAQWTPEFHKTFIYICLDQVQKGNKPGTHLNKEGYRVLCDEFFKTTGKKYDKKQMKNHWDQTKEMWKVWHKLTTNTNSGWDPVTQTLTNEDDFWTDYIQANPKAVEFRHSILPFAKELDHIFGVTTATGDFQLAPNSGVLPSFSEGPIQPPPLDATVGGTHDIMPETQQQSFEDDVGFMESGVTPHGTRQTSIRMKRKRLSEVAWLNSTIDRLVDVVESRSRTNTTHHLNPEKGYTIKECIESLNEMAEMIPVGSELYMAAVESFLNKDMREVFITLPIEVRPAWLERQKRT